MSGRAWRTGAVIAALGAAWSGCGGVPESLDELPAGNDCRRTVLVGAPAASLRSMDADAARRLALREWAVDWRLPPDSLEVARLNAWCAGVGPAVVGGTADTSSAAPVTDAVWVVSWNVYVGGGDLRGLVEDLRAGRLTDGRPVDHFVLLLQEAYRGGDRVPDPDPALPGGSGVRSAPASGPREDIVASAARLGLWVVYVPSMRNGVGEDRGNAILSTLRPRNPTAVELPVARQRRVAVAADVAGRTRGGRDWSLQISTVHLESRPSGWRGHERKRLEQARALVERLPAADAAIAAGDFNTRSRGREEALVPVMRGAYPDTPPFPAGPTYRRVFGIYRLHLDYIFARLPDGAAAAYHRAPRTYGSDHYPLVGQVRW